MHASNVELIFLQRRMDRKHKMPFRVLVNSTTTYVNAFITNYREITYQQMIVSLQQQSLAVSWLIMYAVITCLASFYLKSLRNSANSKKTQNANKC